MKTKNRLAMNWKKDQTLPYTVNEQTFNVRVTKGVDTWTAKVVEPIGNEKADYTGFGPDDVYKQATQAIDIVCLQRKVLSQPQYWQKGKLGEKYEGPSGCPIYLLWQEHLRFLRESQKDITEHQIGLCKQSFYQAAFGIVHELVHFAHDPEEVVKAEAVWLHEVGQNLYEEIDWAEKFGQIESGVKPSTN